METLATKSHAYSIGEAYIPVLSVYGAAKTEQSRQRGSYRAVPGREATSAIRNKSIASVGREWRRLRAQGSEAGMPLE